LATAQHADANAAPALADDAVAGRDEDGAGETKQGARRGGGAGCCLNEQKKVEGYKAAYAAPRMFAVGQTIELIQGSFITQAPQDWPGSWYIYQ
jgi:hypothetical protein